MKTGQARAQDRTGTVGAKRGQGTGLRATQRPERRRGQTARGRSKKEGQGGEDRTGAWLSSTHPGLGQGREQQRAHPKAREKREERERKGHRREAAETRGRGTVTLTPGRGTGGGCSSEEKSLSVGGPHPPKKRQPPEENVRLLRFWRGKPAFSRTSAWCWPRDVMLPRKSLAPSKAQVSCGTPNFDA